MASSRRTFIKGTISSLLLAGITSTAETLITDEPGTAAPTKLRFAIASDGHYGQPGTEYKKDHENMVGWLNQAHQKTPFDFVIINGDLVHDRPDLLKKKYQKNCWRYP